LYARAPEIPGVPRGAILVPRVPGPPPDFATLLYFLGVGSVTWYAAAIAFPLMLLAARRIDLEHRSRVTKVAALSALLAGLVAFSTVASYFATYRNVPRAPTIGAYLPVGLRQNLLPWIALVGIAIAIEVRRRNIRAAVERERLRAQVAEQRLIALTAQLQPHFLFNTLQGISTLIHRDPRAADEMLAKLSDLLRELLRNRDSMFVPLSDEIQLTRTFLEIAKLRFGDRLQFEINAEPDSLEAVVPLFLLQPIVENALRHGIGGSTAGGSISVTTLRQDGRLRLLVENDGARLDSVYATQEGMGLRNTRERLRASFGDDQRFTLENGDGERTRALIEIPYRAAKSGPSS
jgi:two-component sensor histidine kinase